MNNEPAHIEIRFEDHNYTATVYDYQQLEKLCSGFVRERRQFRIGSIFQYGDLNIDELVKCLNRIQHFGTYDRATLQAGE